MIAIQGNGTTEFGAKIIKYLEKRGGNNPRGYRGTLNNHYFINKFGHIDHEYIKNLTREYPEATIISLPEELEEGKEITLGKYKTNVSYAYKEGFYLDLSESILNNRFIFEQFNIKKEELLPLTGNDNNLGDFPYCKTLQNLEDVLGYIRQREKEFLTNKPTIMEKTKNTTVEKTRIIEYHQAQSIIDIACGPWKEKLFDKWGRQIVLKENITISETFYQEMRKACTESQNDLFNTIFGVDFKVGDWVIGWHVNSPDYSQKAWKIAKLKEELVYPYSDNNYSTNIDNIRLATPEEIKIANVPADGTPCLVRDDSRQGYLLRYANGKGSFYKHGKRTGDTINWSEFIILNEETLRNLPVNK